MKKLTLNKAWELCLKQWRWIIKQWQKDSSKVDDLKQIWLIKHGFNPNDVMSTCFFCEYGVQHRKVHRSCCSFCPGKKVDKDFDCMDDDYAYDYEPEKFYKKLLELNRKRTKK